MPTQSIFPTLRVVLVSVLCGLPVSGWAESEASAQHEANDRLFNQVLANTKSFQQVVEIDHARLAYDAGVTTMPSSRVLIFNNPGLTTQLLQIAPMLGLEMPIRILTYEENAESGIAYVDESFLRARYELDASVNLDAYGEDLELALRGVPQARLRPVTGMAVPAGYGIKSIESAMSFDQTIQQVQAAIMAQGDTVWFGTVDYRKDAAALGVELPPATLLLFGGPGPGGMAMTDYPKLGLDAFCQKILILEQDEGTVSLHFNDIVALAELHYGSSNRPQMVINQRLMATLTEAVSPPGPQILPPAPGDSP